MNRADDGANDSHLHLHRSLKTTIIKETHINNSQFATLVCPAPLYDSLTHVALSHKAHGD